MIYFLLKQPRQSENERSETASYRSWCWLRRASLGGCACAANVSSVSSCPLDELNQQSICRDDTESSTSSATIRSLLKVKTLKESLEKHFQVVPSNKYDASSNGQPRVSFAQVTVLTHSISLGDHPGVTTGPPLALGLLRDSRVYDDLDKYESAHQTKRPEWQLKMSALQREARLVEEGFTHRQIEQHIRSLRVERNRVEKRRYRKSIWRR